jgi:hypothetical protein
MKDLVDLSGGNVDFGTFAKQHQPNPKAVQYRRYMDALQSKLQSDDPAVKALRDQMNSEFVAMRSPRADIGPTTVHQNSTLSNVSIQYANDEYIGDRLLPVIPVSKKSDVYYIYDKRSRLAYPDSRLGPRGQANEISESRSTASYLCEGHGFENYVDQETLNNQDAPLNEMVDLTEAIAEGLAFKREVAQATVLCATASYGANYGAVSAADRWDVGGNPCPTILAAIGSLWSGRGAGEVWGFCSYDVMTALATNEHVRDLFKYGGSTPGFATPAMIAGFFGIAGILVGKARKDTANEGQAAGTYSRIWSDVFGLVRVATRPSLRNAAFGYTLRNGPLRTITWFDQRAGVAGGYYGKVTESRDEKVVAADTGYLITTPID